MSLDKGLQSSTCSILPKDPQSAFGNIQTEGDVSQHPSSAAYSHPNLQNLLPSPPPLDISYQHSSYPLQPSEQVYHLHFPQPNFGTAHHLPLPYPYSTSRYDSAFAPPTPLFGGYSNSTVKEFSESRGILPGHRYDVGSRLGPSALPTRDSQRTLVELPRFTSFQDQENPLKSPTDDPGGIASNKSEDSSYRSFAQFEVRPTYQPNEYSQSGEKDVLVDFARPQPQASPSHVTRSDNHPPLAIRSPEHLLRDQPGLPKTTKIPAKGPSSRMHHQHLSATGSTSAMVGGTSSPSAYASSPLSGEDLDWTVPQDRQYPSTQENDSQRTLKEDAKASAFGVVILQTSQGQRDAPLSVDGVQSQHHGQGLLKEQVQAQQHHQGDPFSHTSSFAYMEDGAHKSLSTPAIDDQHPSQLNPARGVPSSPPYNQPFASTASDSSQSYTPLSREDEELHNELQTYLSNVDWQVEAGLHHGDQQKQQEQSPLLTSVKLEAPDGPLNMSAAGTPQSQLVVQSSPMRPVSTTPTVYSTGAASIHSQGPGGEGHNQQGHLIPVTQVGDQFKYDPSRPTFTSHGTPATSTQEVYGSHPISINQSNVRSDIREGMKSAMPAFGYQYMNQEGDNDQHQNGQSRVPMSAAPALGGGITFLQLPGGGQQFYSYSQSGSPGVVVPTSMLQPGRVYGPVDQGSNQYAKQPYTASVASYHPQSANVGPPAGYATNMFYQGRSAGVEPPSAFQMVVSGSHDFFDQSALGHGRRPGMYQVKNEPMSDGMGDDDGENDDTVGDYEQDRLRNIRRNQEMMEKLGLAGAPTRYGDMRSVSRSPLKTVKRKTSSVGLKGTVDHKHRFKSRVPSNIGPLRHSNRLASKQHRSVSYADSDRRGGSYSDSESDYSEDAMEQDEDDWDEDDYRRAPRSRNRGVRRKLSFQQSGRSRGHGRQSRGYRPTLRELLDTYPRVRETFPLFYVILTDDMVINNETAPLIGSIPSTCSPVEKANHLKAFYHRAKRSLAQLDAFTARCDKRYDGSEEKWKQLGHDTKIAIRDIRRKLVERSENYRYTRRDILNRTLGKNNWEPIEEGMITWTPDCGNNDPANDLAGVTLQSPPASSPEPMHRRHASGRQRSGRYANPNDFNDRGQNNLSYAEASVSQMPKTHGMHQYGVVSDDRSNGYPSSRQQSGNENLRHMQNQSRGPWSHGNQDGTFHVPSLPYAAVSVANGQQSSYSSGEPLPVAHHQHYNSSANQQNGNQNQHTYAAFSHSNSSNGEVPEAQAGNAGSESRGAIEEHAASVHELGMIGGIDMDFQMADPSTQSAASMQ